MVKENEQLVKNVKQQEVTLWCKLQEVIIRHLETDCENVFRDLKASNLQKFAKIRLSGKESPLG